MGVVSEPVPHMTVPSVQSEATEEDTEQLNTPTLPQDPMNPHPKSQAFGASTPDLDAPLLPPHPLSSLLPGIERMIQRLPSKVVVIRQEDRHLEGHQSCRAWIQ